MKNFSYTVLPVFMPIPTKFRLSRKMVVSAGIKVAQHWKIIPIFVVISIPQANVDTWVKSQK